MKSRQLLLILVGIFAALVFGSIISAQHFGDWAAPVSMESIPGTSSEFNTTFNDGCSYQAPDGLSFYMASNRPGGMGWQDIWVAYRDSTDEPFGTPVNLPAPINNIKWFSAKQTKDSKLPRK